MQTSTYEVKRPLLNYCHYIGFDNDDILSCSSYSFRSLSDRAQVDLPTRVATIPEDFIPKTMDFSNFRDTGELSDIVVSVDGTEYKLHKFPLYIKSDFFRAIARSNMGEKDKVELVDFPGGAETFELVANYCYNMKIDIKQENVCRLRCAAEFLQMTTGGQSGCGHGPLLAG